MNHKGIVINPFIVSCSESEICFRYVVIGLDGKFKQVNHTIPSDLFIRKEGSNEYRGIQPAIF